MNHSWMKSAQCIGQYLLFDAAESDPSAEARAKMLCWTCPVKQPCAEYGRKDEYLIWGGKAARDRVHIRRRHTRESVQATRRNQLSFEVA